jgi:transcriptional regulator with XRE-family HTH domain
MFALKLLRVMLGIGQAQLASRAGISVRELARIESGEVQPSAPAWAAYDKALAEIIEARALATADKETT